MLNKKDLFELNFYISHSLPLFSSCLVEYRLGPWRNKSSCQCDEVRKSCYFRVCLVNVVVLCCVSCIIQKFTIYNQKLWVWQLKKLMIRILV